MASEMRRERERRAVTGRGQASERLKRSQEDRLRPAALDAPDFQSGLGGRYLTIIMDRREKGKGYGLHR